MPSRGFIVPLAIAIVALLAAGGFGFYEWEKGRAASATSTIEMNSQIAASSLTSTAASSTAGWQTYFSTYGFVVKYQPGVVVGSVPSNFGWATGLSEPGVAAASIPVIAQGLGSGEVHIGFSTSTQSAADCEKDPSNSMQTYESLGTTTIDSIAFAHFKVYQPAAGQFASIEIYRAYPYGICFSIEPVLMGTETNRLSGSQLSKAEADYAKVQGELDAVVDSFRVLTTD